MPTEFCIARADLYIKQHCLNWQKKRKICSAFTVQQVQQFRKLDFSQTCTRKVRSLNPAEQTKTLPESHLKQIRAVIGSEWSQSMCTQSWRWHWCVIIDFWILHIDQMLFSFVCLFVFNHLSCGMDHLLSADTIRKQWGVWPITDCTRCLPRRRMMAQW